MSRGDFIQTWLVEHPQRTGKINPIDAIRLQVAELKRNGYQPETVAPNTYKINTGNLTTYWSEINGEITIGSTVEKHPLGSAITLTGKSREYKNQPPWASDLYSTILKDTKTNVRLLSDKSLSDEGLGIWKQLIKLGHTVSVYDSNSPGTTMKTFSDPEELDQWFGDTKDYRNYQYVMIESTALGDYTGQFMIRRYRELCGTEDE